MHVVNYVGHDDKLLIFYDDTVKQGSRFSSHLHNNDNIDI